MNIPANLMLENREEYLKLINIPSQSAQHNTANSYEQLTRAIECGHPLAYVCIYGSNYVSVVDIIEAQRILDIEVGFSPLSIDINPKKPLAYVTNFTENSVSMIDLENNETVRTATVGLLPAGIKTTGDGRLVYVVHNGEPSVYVLNAYTLKKVLEIPLPSVGFLIDITADGAFAFVGLRSTAQVAVIDLSVNLVVKVIPAGAGTEDVKISPSEKLVFVTNEDANSITPISIPLAEPASPNIPTRNAPVGLAFTNGGRTLYCANRQDQSVSVFDVFTHREREKIQGGNGPYGAAATRGGRFVVISNSYEDTVSIIDTRTNTVTDAVTVGTAPAFLAIL